jgi:hypothetical protein
MTGKTVEQLIAEGDLIEAGRQVGRDIRTRMMGGFAAPQRETVEERRHRKAKLDEECRNDPTKELYRTNDGYRWRDTEDAMFAKGELWQLAERQALEAARTAYKDELRWKAKYYLEVVESELAKLKAEGLNEDDTWFWYLDGQRKKLKLWAEGRPKPTPERVRDQTRERVRKHRAKRKREQDRVA